MDKTIPNVTLKITEAKIDESGGILDTRAVLTDIETKETTNLRISKYLARAEFTASDFTIEALSAGSEYETSIQAILSPTMPGHSTWYFTGDDEEPNELKCYLEILPATEEILELNEDNRLSNLTSFGKTELETPLEDFLKRKQTNAEVSFFNYHDMDKYKVLRLKVFVAEKFYDDLLKSIQLNRLKEMYVTLQSEKIVWANTLYGELKNEDVYFLCTDTPNDFSYTIMYGHCHIRSML